MVEERKYGVHATHCCEIHGCKYGDEDCPVRNKQVKQLYTCEYCTEEGFKEVENVYEYVEIQKQVKKAKEEGTTNLTVSVDFLDRMLNRNF